MIHSTAIVSNNCNLGDDVTIGPYCIVEDDVVVGDGCELNASCILRSGTILEANVKVDSFAVIAGLPQDLSFVDSTRSFARVGEGTVIRESVTIHRSSQEGGETVVGKNCFLMTQSHIGHDCKVADDVIVCNNVLLAGHVHVARNVFLGGAAGIHQFCRIGEGAMFGGDSTATLDVPPFCILADRNQLIGLNLVGLKRREHSREAIRFLKSLFQQVCNEPGNIRKIAADLLSQDNGKHWEAKTFLEFFAEGTRGFVRPRK